jgi:hypothetical protein
MTQTAGSAPGARGAYHLGGLLWAAPRRARKWLSVVAAGK